jgi:NodT family efflux transporter outer membrane factor (OMF) lipoprotein
MRSFCRTYFFATLVLLTMLAAGCAVHQPTTRVLPSVPAGEQFVGQPAVTEPVVPATPLWWRAFDEPALDALVEEALRNNLEIRQLAARIDQAAALLRQAGGRLLPALDAAGDVGARWDRFNRSTAPARDDSTSLGMFLSWEADVWGRLRAARAARGHEVSAAVHDWLGGRLILSASVAETYFEIVEQRQQLGLLRGQIAVNQTLLDLTKLRFGQGQSSIVDVLQQQEQLASTRSRVPDIESRLQQLEYALDVLVGRAPGGRDRFQDRAITAPPALPAPGVPSELLDRRPDLLAARDSVQALDQRVGEAIADRLPRFVMGGSLAAAGDPTITGLIGSTFASAAQPLFDAGIRKAEVELRRARLREALDAYAGRYLAAVQEVETALVRERNQGERVERLQAQLDVAQRLLTETRNRYAQGLTDYLPVLNALVTVQSLQRDVLTSRRVLLSQRIALHRALGGPMHDEPVRTASRSEDLSP